MGSSRWSSASYSTYADSTNLHSKSKDELFSRRGLDTVYNPKTRSYEQAHSKLDPKTFSIRESCDSDVNPESTPIIMGLDVTGSMGKYAEEIAKIHLPKLMNTILEQKPISDPHLMFMGIDDVHAYSQASLQVSQFEADIEILKQLEDMWLVSGGGGNMSESYDLAWYFAAHRTKIDCFDKRGKHGFLFTFGDEAAPYQKVSSEQLKSVFGKGQYQSFMPEEILKEAQRKYQVFHVVIEQGSYCSSPDRYDNVKRTWTKLLGNNVLFLKDSMNLSDLVVATLKIANGEDIMTVINNSSCPKVLEHAFQNSFESTQTSNQHVEETF